MQWKFPQKSLQSTYPTIGSFPQPASSKAQISSLNQLTAIGAAPQTTISNAKWSLAQQNMAGSVPQTTNSNTLVLRNTTGTVPQTAASNTKWNLLQQNLIGAVPQTGSTNLNRQSMIGAVPQTSSHNTDWETYLMQHQTNQQRSSQSLSPTTSGLTMTQQTTITQAP